MKILALVLMSLVFILAIILGEEAKDNLGAAMAVGAIFGGFTAVPIVLLVALAARGGLHIHLHRHERPGQQLTGPIDANARVIEGSTQVTVTENWAGRTRARR